MIHPRFGWGKGGGSIASAPAPAAACESAVDPRPIPLAKVHARVHSGSARP